jgi:phosphohistidine swiveling domain-containing protein
LAEPTVTAAITTGAPETVQATLQQTAAGRAFLSDLDTFLAQYGRRGEIWGIAYPTWQEDPTPVIRTLRDYIMQPDRDLDHDLAAAAARREARLTQVRRQLQGYPQQVVDQFEFLLKAAQMGTILSEDHGYWIDFVASAAVRKVLLEFGRRFAAAGAIERADDIFYLSLDELRQTATGQPMPDRHDLVATRKAEEAHFATVTPPAALGTPQTGAPPSDDPIARTLLRFFGGPPPAQDTPGLLRGNPGAAGTVVGPVKVVHNLGEASKLKPGDVLVAVTTAPPWTPLFATVAAVITDTGGVLSHCAVVAREYGIPAVVGTGAATTLLHDGQLVEVDGTSGTVRILDGAA